MKKCVLPADADILPAYDDRIFKMLLTHPDAERVLIDVVSTVIEKKVVAVQVRNIELPVANIEEKLERFDINCTIENGDQVDVEMHSSERIEVGKRRSNFINKYIYYLTDLHSSQKSKGIAYEKLARTYQVTFCTHNVFSARKDFVSRFSLRTKDGEQLSDQINMIIIELDKLTEALKKPVEKLTSVEKWSMFFKFASDPVQRTKLNDIINDKEEINMAAVLLREISQEERERAIERSRRMYETDMISDRLTSERKGEIRGIKKGRKQGREQGLKQGVEQGLKQGEMNNSIKIARKLLVEGMSPEFINKITGVSFEEIKALM